MDNLINSMDLEFFANAENFLLNKEPFLKLLQTDKVIFLDVRDKKEVELLTFGFAKNVPLNQLADKVDELKEDSKTKMIVTFCPGKIRATMAFIYLKSKGVENVKILNATSGDLADSIKPGFIKNYNR